MRDLFKVMDAILAIVPSDFPGLRGDLEKRRASLIYTAPECMGDRWHEVGHILASHIEIDWENMLDWQREIARIWKGDPVPVPATTPCKHDRLNEEGICRSCGSDCRGIGGGALFVMGNPTLQFFLPPSDGGAQ